MGSLKELSLDIYTKSNSSAQDQKTMLSAQNTLVQQQYSPCRHNSKLQKNDKIYNLTQ